MDEKGVRAVDVQALMDMARVDQTALLRVPRKLAHEVVLALAQQALDMKQLFKLIVHSVDPDALFTVLYASACTDMVKRHALLDAVVTAPAAIWDDDVLDMRFVAARFASAEDFEHLLKHHREALLYQHNEMPVLWHFSPNLYWCKRVRWYIAKHDWRRAWDELRKANRGFFVGEKKDAPRFGKINLIWYCYAASETVVATLACQLYDGMFARHVFAPITDKERSGKSDKDAVMAKLSAYFREQRNAQRRKKWQAAADAK